MMKTLSVLHRRDFLLISAGICGAQKTFAGLLDPIKQMAGLMPTLHIAALDISLSPQEGDARTLYLQAVKAMLVRAKPGDTILLLPLGEQGQSSVPIQKFNLMKTGRSLEDERIKKEVLPKIEATARELLGQKARVSRLIEGLAATRPEVQNALQQGHGVQLWLCSDVLEDSPLGHMASGFDKTQAERLLAQVKQNNLLLNAPHTDNSTRKPNIEARVIGAGGQTASTYQQVEAFWRSYFAASGIALQHYGRTVPG
jgi:hypothetical protein